MLTKNNTVPIFEKWVSMNAIELYIRAKRPKRLSKYSYVLSRITLRNKGTMIPIRPTNTMGTISP